MTTFCKLIAVCGAWVVLVAVNFPVIAPTKLTGPKSLVPSAFFGLHIHHAVSGMTVTPWPNIPFKGWRLWDSGVTWPEIEPQKSRWNFAVLDKEVSLAEQHHVEVLLPLAFSPAWISKRPLENPGKWPPVGSAAEPKDIAEWRAYVRTVANRYKGRVHYYEIWNEPNLPVFFSGKVEDMVALASEAYTTLKEIDPDNLVVSPSPTQDGSGPKWLAAFLAQGGGKFCDVIGYHFYVTPRPPEDMVPLIRKVRGIMSSYGASQKPLWNTESGWEKTKVFDSEEEAAAYLARTYILNWAAGVSRLYWYSLDDHHWVNLYLTKEDNKTLTRAGEAYAEVQRWLVGATLNYCKTDAQNDWICELRRENHSSWIVWNPDKKVKFAIPRDWKAKQTKTLDGARMPLISSSAIIGQVPLLFEDYIPNR